MISRQFQAHLLSPAKLNLGLNIIGRRKDGYHLLESLFWPLSWGDEIEMTPSKENSHQVICEWHPEAPRKGTLPKNESNLVTLGLQKLDSVLKDRFKITLKKRIPVGSGLGGGSSNLGTLLKWILEKYPLYKNEIVKTAQELGADVSFFLNPKPAFMEGVGEIQNPSQVNFLSKEQLTFILIFPEFGCSTPEIFKTYSKISSGYSKSITPQNLTDYLKFQKNDLENAAALLNPQLEEILKELKSLDGLYSGMSGSGSTCFAMFNSKNEAEKKIKGLSSFCRENNCKSLLAGTYNTEH
jgi:4-diphosphocytidyl-2-C-methyl-D-erythritol kinase